MKTKQEVRKYAEALAWGFFYSDEDVLWEPFEHHPQGWIEEEMDNLASVIENAILWGQK